MFCHICEGKAVATCTRCNRAVCKAHHFVNKFNYRILCSDCLQDKRCSENECSNEGGITCETCKKQFCRHHIKRVDTYEKSHWRQYHAQSSSYFWEITTLFYCSSHVDLGLSRQKEHEILANIDSDKIREWSEKDRKEYKTKESKNILANVGCLTIIALLIIIVFVGFSMCTKR